MKVCLATIKHTGTHFVSNHLRAMGLPQGLLQEDRYQRVQIDNNWWFHIHFGERHHYFDYIDTDGEPDYRVVTLRDPRKVLKTLMGRRPFTLGGAEKFLLDSFKHWKEYVEKYDPIVIKVDADSINGQIESLAKQLGFTDYKYTELDKNSLIPMHDVNFYPPQSVIDLAHSLGYRL